MIRLRQIVVPISLVLAVLPPFAYAASDVGTAVGSELSRLAGLGDINGVRGMLADGVEATEHEPLHGTTALHNASAQGHLAIARALVDAGADIEAQDVDGATAIVFAAYHGRSQVVRFLLQAGAEVDHVPHTGPTALVAACLTGRTDAALVLIAGGASPDLVDANGMTARSAAAIGGRDAIFRALGTPETEMGL